MSVRFAHPVVGVVLSIGMAIVGGAATASPVTLSQNGPLFGPSDARTTVNVTGTGNVSAGGFHVTDGTDDFIAWCVDITHYLKLGTEYEATSNPFSNTFTFGSRVADIENLFNTGYDGLDTNSDVEVAGFQLAIWELVYETTASLDITGGSFHTESIGSSSATYDSAKTFANGLLSGLNGPATGAYDVTFWESQGYYDHHQNLKYSQNLVSAMPSAVPLPAGLGLLGFALASLFGLRRRRTA